MTSKTLDAFVTGTIDTMKRALAPRDERLAALERRLELLEGRPQLKWAGAYTPGTFYRESSLATKGGSLWVQRRTQRRRPAALAIGN